MIWIIGGTSEARELVDRIRDLEDKFIVTVATESGKEFLDIKNLEIGRMNLEEMENFIQDRNIGLIVDLTHPFAKIVSENAAWAAENMSIDYLRYSRPRIDSKSGVILNSYEEAYDYIDKLESTIFFTSGSNNIEEFEKVKGKSKHIYRILPARESLNKCIENQVHIRDIVALVGPFSLQANKSMFQEYKAEYVVMKDSGKKGGTEEKIKACEELGIIAIIIAREKEEAVGSLDELENQIRSYL